MTGLSFMNSVTIQLSVSQFRFPLSEGNDDVNSSKDRAHHFPFTRLFLAHFSGDFYEGAVSIHVHSKCWGSFGLTIREVRKINEPSLEGTVEIFSLTASSRELLPCYIVHGSSDLSQRQCHQARDSQTLLEHH